jgi:predicted methyltransferase
VPVTFRQRAFSGSQRRCVMLVLAFACCFLPGTCAAQNSGAARDAWQHPVAVMDALGIHKGSVVADVGCGAGYFTFQLAQRVGPQGHVYAEDVLKRRLDQVRKEANREGLRQITTVHGTADNPRLPPGSLDVVLAVNTYHEWHEHGAMLASLYHDLKPGGIFGLIDAAAPSGFPRSYYYEEHRMPEALERTEVVEAGFHFLRQEHGFTRPSDGRKFYFLVFQKSR